jgi:hypothetical protein
MAWLAWSMLASIGVAIVSFGGGLYLMSKAPMGTVAAQGGSLLVLAALPLAALVFVALVFHRIWRKRARQRANRRRLRTASRPAPPRLITPRAVAPAARPRRALAR